MAAAKGGPKGLGDYVEVADRIQEFYERYPDGRLVTAGFEFREVGDKTWILVQAKAYRTPDDPHPGVGTAWEQYPGKTPFTRDSELMNAETSAWGRAMAAVGIAVKSGIATREDVRNRRADNTSNSTVSNQVSTISPERTTRLLDLVDAAGIKPAKLQGLLVAVNPDADIKTTKGWSKRAIGSLTDRQADGLVEKLEALIKAQTPGEPKQAEVSA